MSFHNHHHHNNNHHPTTTTTCCCHHQPPYTTPDPLLLSTVISQLLHTPPPQNHPHQFQHPHSILTSLIQRIDALESSLTRYSSSSSSSSSPYSSSSLPSSSLRHVAARTIQTHFRSYLVRRSRTLRHLQELSLVKSRVGFLKSSFYGNGFVDFDSLSRIATDLLLNLDSIKSCDKMIRDSKRSITREIVEFLDMADGVCVRKREVLTKTTKNMRTKKNDCRTHDSRVSSGYEMGSKCESMNNNERKLMANLKKRVERIGRMSRALQENEMNGAEMEGYEVLENEGDVIDRITNKYRMQNLESVKNTLNPNAKKQVCIVEDGNVVRVYDDNGVVRGAFKDIDDVEDSSKGKHDEQEEKDESDGGEQSSQSSGDAKNHNCHHDSHYNQDGDFTFSAPEPVLMEARADSGTRKPGVKIVG